MNRRVKGTEDEAEVRRVKAPLVGVEPVMFFYMAAFMTTTVSEEAFFIYKACRSNLLYPEEICRNINNPEYKNFSQKVQVETSLFHQYQNIAAYGIPVFLAFFVGAWSDRVGRKLPLLLGLIGSLIYSLMIILNAVNESWGLNVILWTATLPCALSGAMLTIFMASFAYLSDTTTPEQRTIRVTILEIAYLLPMPLGIAFGSYLYNGPFDHSFAKMFAVNAAFLMLAILWTLFFLPWKTRPCSHGPVCSTSHIGDTLRTLFRPRMDSRRLLLILALLAMFLYTLQRDEKRMMQMYALNVFHWGVKEFSHFKTIMSSFYIVGLLIGIPILKYVFKMGEVWIMIVGALSHIAARFIFIFGDSDWFTAGAVVCTLGPVVAPMLRSLTSRLVPSSERGKVFALLSVADTTCPLFSGFVFSQVYIHFFTSFPGAIFLVTIVSQVIVIFIALMINLKGGNIKDAQEEQDENESFH